MSIAKSEDFKNKAKSVRKFLSEKYDIDVSHCHCLEIVSQILDFKNWNVASAKIKQEISLPIHIKTVGDMKRTLELFQESAIVDGEYEFNVGEFLSGLTSDEVDGEITQEFSLVLERVEPDIVSFKLKLEHESIMFSQ